MSDVVIRAAGLGKRYRVGRSERYKTLRDTIMRAGASVGRIFSGGGARDDAATAFWALKGVDFDVRRGQVLGVIGRNGAGKSTLLKVLSRITEPTEGVVDIHGRVGSLLEVGTGFHPELTGRENIFMNGAILGMSRAEIRGKFDEIVAFSEVERHIDTPVKRYSSGMYTRLAFAVAAHMETEILIVDEVLAVGDAEFQKRCLGKMKDVGRSGRTVLFVSHNMRAVENLCDSALRLHKGQVAGYSSDVGKVVAEYMQGGKTEGMLSEWRNDGRHGDAQFRPLRFWLCDADWNLVDPIQRADADVYVAIEGEIEQYDPALCVGYAMLRDDGQSVYHTYQTDASESEWPELGKGRFRIRSAIPKRLMAEGTYRIDLMAGIFYRYWIFESGVNSPGLTLSIQGGFSDSSQWMGRHGVLTPVLRWEGERL